jgi:hypothetical protein
MTATLVCFAGDQGAVAHAAPHTPVVNMYKHMTADVTTCDSSGRRCSIEVQPTGSRCAPHT